MPPRLSTGSSVSLTWAGTNRHAMNRATNASGSVTRNTDPHSNFSSRNPDTSGPSDAIAPPRADHRAIECVRPGPGAQSAVISARVVGYAMPAEMPPTMRATISISMLGANAATRQAGIESPTPRRSSILRPYRSPIAPSHRTDAARPSE